MDGLLINCKQLTNTVEHDFKTADHRFVDFPNLLDFKLESDDKSIHLKSHSDSEIIYAKFSFLDFDETC